MSPRLRPSRQAGFTIPEVMVVVGVIFVLLAFLLPALAGVWKTGRMTSSMNNLKQIATMMRQYSTDNREYILPSQFDYSANPYPGKVRSADDPQLGEPHQGTWCDILWTEAAVAVFPDLVSTLGQDYRYDSPDTAFYEANPGFTANPFRSAGLNSRNFAGSSIAIPDPGPKPFGDGAQEAGKRGYFAANDFFNARPDAPGNPPALGRWYVTGQIKAPDRSMYLVDSVAGETIEPVEAPFNTDPAANELEVDFRYNEVCLMLFLDGHVAQQNPWADLDDLESNRSVKVRALTEN